jgi:NAD(P)-dependent dehydrogenase (short-subunit alcohol dehydrogenase family)
VNEQIVDPAFATGVAIVAGGSGGIGAKICLTLAEAGSSVLLTYRTQRESAEEVARKIRQMGREAQTVALDLTDALAVQAMVDEARKRYGAVQSMVYAAGPSLHMQFVSQVPPADWARIIHVDVCGCFNFFTAGLGHMKANGGGSCVALTTAAVERIPARDVCSVAPKAAIEALVRTVAKEEGRHHIRANCVGPGWIDAGLGRQVLQLEMQPEQVESIRRAIPLQRFGEAQDVAEAVVFLLSSKAAYITGQSIAVDGGMQL